MKTFLVIRSRTLNAAMLLGLAGSALLHGAGANLYLQHNLVSNIAGAADFTDPNLVDPWAIAFNAASPFWVSDHLSGKATIYSGNGTPSATVVTIPAAGGATTPGRPTGQVQNSSTAFVLANGKAASFIFATDDGTISAWNGGTVATVMVDNSNVSAVYKGLAINPSGPMLYAANFRSGKIDVFSGTFSATTVPGGFTDPNLPSGFAPFNIWALNGKLYVTYAKQDSAQFLDVAGAGNGFVDVFDFKGNLLNRLVSNGALNSPWGVAIAPAGWGAFGGNLLVGNFGDGTINAFDVNTGNKLGSLQDANGNIISIAGLWAIGFGNGGRGGDPSTLYFTAGVPDGTTTPRGILGSIAPPATISAIFNGAGGESAAIAPGEIVAITGQTVGPSPLVSAVLPVSGSVGSTVGTTSVTFNNLPAPVIYASAAQTAVIVPYGVAGSTTASVVLKTGSQTTPAFSIPVAASVPGVFTSNASGAGSAVAFNQDGTVNSATNPAVKGSVVVLFATGEGVTNPPGQDGLIASTDILREPVLPVTLSIGGVSAQVLYAGSSPGNVAGVMEVEAIVPAAAASGADAVVLSVGTATSQANVVVNVK
jgi:uncharacterized protein (TIGR03118 family)